MYELYPPLISFIPNFRCIFTICCETLQFYPFLAIFIYALYFLRLHPTRHLHGKIIPELLLWTSFLCTIAYFSTPPTALSDDHPFDLGGLLYAPGKTFILMRLLGNVPCAATKQRVLLTTAILLPPTNLLLARILPVPQIHTRDPLHIKSIPSNIERGFQRPASFSIPSGTVVNALFYLFLADTPSKYSPSQANYPSRIAFIIYCIYLLPMYTVRSPSPTESTIAFLISIGIYCATAKVQILFPTMHWDDWHGYFLL
jgi:hypothetical protein